ncbi:hypothetical protein CWR48_08365 [Oceanobacillus arenosus]|uniref:Uncharacterized protein n=1 Tax=Oceanobacillus arenosus TaxID=1229153 RepID=A0A3D8PSW1_9BACI|nr:hypothetical protein [Oceanobacillus arenosus]RDW19054.1 hypothetical protein CWR48_08365 [Oceanobacillus arenosus]
MEFTRDYAMYTAIFGMFSMCWFGWAQENPRKSWRKYLGLASGIALVVSIIGIYLSVTHWHSPSALADSTAYKNYLIFFFLEFTLAGIGAFFLIKFKRSNFVSPWIAFIVGIHFIWMKDVFQDASLYILAVLLIGISFISLPLSKMLEVPNSAITGALAGTALFCFAIIGLIRFLLIR